MGQAECHDVQQIWKSKALQIERNSLMYQAGDPAAEKRLCRKCAEDSGGQQVRLCQ